MSSAEHSPPLHTSLPPQGASLQFISDDEAIAIETAKLSLQPEDQEGVNSADAQSALSTVDSSSEQEQSERLRQLVSSLSHAIFADTAAPSVLIKVVQNRYVVTIHYNIDSKRPSETWSWARTNTAPLSDFTTYYLTLIEEWIKLLRQLQLPHDASQIDPSSPHDTHNESEAVSSQGKVTVFLEKQVAEFKKLRQRDASSLRDWFNNFAHIVSLPYRVGLAEKRIGEVASALKWVVVAFFELGCKKGSSAAVTRNGLDVVRHLVTLSAFNDPTWELLRNTLKAIKISDDSIIRIRTAVLSTRASNVSVGEEDANNFHYKLNAAEASSIYHM